jgi:hypothetical protein
LKISSAPVRLVTQGAVSIYLGLCFIYPGYVTFYIKKNGLSAFCYCSLLYITPVCLAVLICVFFSFFRKPIEELKQFSCTEGTCKRKSKLGTLNNYEPQPVANSKCFKTLKKKTANINVEFVHNVAKEMLPRSSWNLHR